MQPSSKCFTSDGCNARLCDYPCTPLSKRVNFGSSNFISQWYIYHLRISNNQNENKINNIEIIKNIKKMNEKITKEINELKYKWNKEMDEYFISKKQK